jgi:outer membrane protein OmpA-like peptidoglycan-associated protein
MKLRIFVEMLAGIILSACSSTTVVLVPDAEGKVGQVELTTDGGSTVLTKAYESAKTKDEKQAPTELGQLSEENVRDMYADVLANEPSPPEHFFFYFKTGKSSLLAEANEALVKVKATVEARKSCDLSVIGYTDRVRDNNFNDILSMVRAENVANALKGIGIAQHCMDIRYYGENHPAIPTEDETDEPRNRRVEVQVR